MLRVFFLTRPKYTWLYLKAWLGPQLVTPVGYFEGFLYPCFTIWADYKPRAEENIKNASVLRIWNERYSVLSCYGRMISENSCLCCFIWWSQLEVKSLHHYDVPIRTFVFLEFDDISQTSRNRSLNICFLIQVA